MNDQEAAQIADLLNQRNQLAQDIVVAGVLAEQNGYVYEVRQGTVVACVEHRNVQWYQWEILHLSVAPDWERRGLCSIVYQRAEQAARSRNICLLQCTIRDGNKQSEGFFTKQGFSKTCACFPFCIWKYNIFFQWCEAYNCKHWIGDVCYNACHSRNSLLFFT